MLHNVLARQLPFDAAEVTAALDGGRHRPRAAPADPRGRGVAGPARGARPDRGRPARRVARRRARDGRHGPVPRLTPVVRLAPAKLNLTLAVVGRRPDGFHELHSVFVPLGLADRLSLAHAGGHADSLHVEGFDPGPPSDNLVFRALAAVRAAVGGGWAGGPGPAPALAARLEKRIPVAAGLAGGSSRRRRDDRRRAGGVGRRARSRRAPARRGRSSARTCRSSWPAGRPSSRDAASGSRRCAACAATPGVLLVTPAVPVSTHEVFDAFDGAAAASATARSACRRSTSPRSSARACRPRTSLARAGVLAVANDLAARDGRGPARARGVPAGADPAPRRPIGLSGLRPDPLGALSFARPTRPAAADLVRASLRDGTLTRARRRRAVRRRHEHRHPASRRRSRRHDPPSRPTTGRPGRGRPVQPGHRRRRPALLRRPGVARPADRRDRRGRHRGPRPSGCWRT